MKTSSAITDLDASNELAHQLERIATSLESIHEQFIVLNTKLNDGISTYDQTAELQ